jgi:hypothetical protein
MTTHNCFNTSYVVDGRIRSFRSRTLSKQHELLRNQYPAETQMGILDDIGGCGFALFVIEETIANDAWREWKKQREEEQKQWRAKQAESARANRLAARAKRASKRGGN